MQEAATGEERKTAPPGADEAAATGALAGALEASATGGARASVRGPQTDLHSSQLQVGR